LQSRALEQFAYKFHWPVAEDGTVELWTWDPAINNVRKVNVSVEMASLTVGLRFARQALSLAPDDEDLQALYLGLNLAQAKQLAAPEGRLPAGPGTAFDLALTSGVPLVSRTLDLALEHGNAAAAEAALHVLGQIGTVPELLAAGKASPLLKAFDSPDRQVQFAAAVAVMEMNPTAPFPGAERAVAVFSRALRNEERSAVIVDANAPRANQVAALIGEMGYVPHVAHTGQDGFRAASSRMDVDLVVLNINTIRWPLSVTIANLRADARTARIPIAIYGPDNMRDRVASLLQRYDAVTYVIEATASEEFDSQLRPVLARLHAPQLSEVQRAEQRSLAAYWLADIASRQTDVFDLRPAEAALLGAVQDPTLSENILLALSASPSASVQQALQQIAVSGSFPARQRESAALQLAAHIQRFDLLLSAEQVDELRSSWQAAEDPALATALAGVLGTLKPNSRQVGLRLKEFAPVPAP
jgi:DNA-binding response OmpR family regulator